MSKGLEALKELHIKVCENCPYNKPNMDGDVCSKCEEILETIEKALKEHEQYEEILNDYGLTLVNFREACLLLAMLKGSGRNIHNIDKQLKAFEIIKDKSVNVETFINVCSKVTYETYERMWNNGCFMGIKMSSKEFLTEEEFDLLKEMLYAKKENRT